MLAVAWPRPTLMGTVVRSSTSSSVRRSWGTLRQRRDDVRRASPRPNAGRVFRVPAMPGHMGRILRGSVTGTHWRSQRRAVRGIRRAGRLYLLDAFNRIFAWTIDHRLIADRKDRRRNGTNTGWFRRIDRRLTLDFARVLLRQRYDVYVCELCD